MFTGTGIFNGQGPLDEDTLQISAIFMAATADPTLPTVNIAYAASMPTATLAAIANVSGTVAIQVGPPPVGTVIPSAISVIFLKI